MQRWRERARSLAAQVLVYGAVPGVLGSAVLVRPGPEEVATIDQGRARRMEDPAHVRRCSACRRALEEQSKGGRDEGKPVRLLNRSLRTIPGDDLLEARR
jgi:hypothetical protein